MFSLLVVLAAAALAQTPDPLPLPLRPDPPFTVDGALDDWSAVPGELRLDRPEQAVWGGSAWLGAGDCGATVKLAWRYEALYVAAEVRDDLHRQLLPAAESWRGDCLMVFLDLVPDARKEDSRFGEGQFQIGLSPGNFLTSGDALRRVAPEVYCFKPGGRALEGARIAAKQVGEGYTLEASIPWAALGLSAPRPNYRLWVELGLSDADGEEPQLDTMLTISSAKWDIARDRLLPAVLAQADGAFEASAGGTPVFESLQLERDGEQAIPFQLGPVPAGLEAVLRMEARLDFPQVAGYNPALSLALNGTPILAERLVNKPLRAKARGGDIYSLAAGERFSTYYSPDFTSPDTHPHYGLVDPIRPALFEFRVTDLLHAGDNVLTIAHRGEVENLLIVAGGAISFVSELPKAAQKAGPPEGALPQIQPKAAVAFAGKVETLPEGLIRISLPDQTLEVRSRFSSPDGTWGYGSNAFFRHVREVGPRGEALVIADTFTNLTEQPLPLMHRHELSLGAAPDALWLAGLDQPALRGQVSSPSNPTLCVTAGAQHFGVLPLDDVFRIHSTAYCLDQVAGLADHGLVLAPGATYRAEWALIPQGDYWDFLNAARRLLEANFVIDGGFAFLRNGPPVDGWSDQQVADFLRFKDAKYVSASLAYPLYNGTYSHGTAFQRIDLSSYKDAFTRWRGLAPERKYLVYFHCFIDVVEDGPELFKDSLLLDPEGNQGDYGYPVDRLYLPLENNRFGPAVAKNVDLILDDLQADGVYWDEHEYSRLLYHYGEPWDGFSGDIDPDTLQLRRLKSSVTLLTEPYRLALAKRILGHGSLIGNGPPFTKAMAALKFPCFVETGSITHCAQSHLHSPIALGDHLTERTELDAYRTMLAALDFGCVYHWYNDVTVIPTHPHLTSYMFPITPMELQEGYIIGEERIVTKRSGLFGWGDLSEHEVHVFDDTGREVRDFSAPQQVIEGACFTELRLAEDWSAAIIRNP